jgi:toxin ParE1/3/4
MIVRYTRRARGDLAKILNYLDERSPRGALSVRLAIKRTIDTISRNPNIGRLAARGRNPRACRWVDIRISFSGRFEADEIWLLHIRHGARRVWRG